MDAAGWRTNVLRYFTENASAFGLDADTLDVQYVLNWGGFVNHSFQVCDASRRLHLKLAVQRSAQRSLTRWHALDPILRAHRAPPVLERLEIAGATALLFPHRSGQAPVLSEEVLEQLLPALQRLWADDALQERLQPAAPRTAREGYLASYHRRFTADLRAIAATPPPFVDTVLLDQLYQEVTLLEARVSSEPGFQHHVTTPIHGDLWLNNILWTDENDWTLLDWDDVQIGDPAMDLATLLGPAANDLQPLKLMPTIASALTPPLRERLELLGRASLLDWVIDPLADWIEASAAPAVQDEVRAEKQRVHLAAWERYQARYGA